MVQVPAAFMVAVVLVVIVHTDEVEDV